MWTKATIVGGVAAVTLVAGGAGMAIAHAQGTASPTAATDTPSGGATTSTAAPGAAAKVDKSGRDVAKQILGNLKNFQHAEWVTKSDANTYVTHEAILGQVTAVSSTSITVKSTDGTSLTFAVTADTKVHQRQAKGSTATATATPTTPTTPTIADIKNGQTVLVGGEKSPDLTAKNVVARAS
ncbi:MAG: hypothetical protein ABJA74_03405 [Lapillicoccus sp.]